MAKRSDAASRVWRRVQDLARLLLPGEASAEAPDGPATKGKEDEATEAAGSPRLAALAQADPGHEATWSAVSAALRARDFAGCEELLTDLYLHLLVARVSAALSRHGAGRPPAETTRAQERLLCVRLLAKQFPPCAATCEKVARLLAAGDADAAVRPLERMLDGMARKGSDILWPPATHSSWIRTLHERAGAGDRAKRDEFFAAYAIPVRELLQRKFKLDLETANEVATDFLGDAVLKNSLAHYDPGTGKRRRFRDYLAASILHYYPKWRASRVVEGERVGEWTADEEKEPAAEAREDPFECSLWRWGVAAALAEAWTEVQERERAPRMWEVFEARAFGGAAASASHEALAARLGLTAYQINNYLHQVRRVVSDCVARLPGTRMRKGAPTLDPPKCCAEDARLTFASPNGGEPRLEARVGEAVPVRVFVRDAAGHVNPLTAAAGAAIVRVEGVGRVLSPAPHLFRGVLLDGRYVRMAEALVRSAEPGELVLGLADPLGTDLDVSERFVVRWRRG
ncbi:MAG: hypothetical protein HYZ53_17575 [Planctomycetes bacterium]|nr:hypothetical protein [Planctomycetota bacterium]